MSEDDITILNLDLKPKSRLCYYQGNFYHPLNLPGDMIGIVKRAIRTFIKENKQMVDKDRKHPDYKNVLQIFDAQMKKV